MVNNNLPNVHLPKIVLQQHVYMNHPLNLQLFQVLVQQKMYTSMLDIPYFVLLIHGGIIQYSIVKVQYVHSINMVKMRVA